MPPEIGLAAFTHMQHYVHSKWKEPSHPVPTSEISLRKTASLPFFRQTLYGDESPTFALPVQRSPTLASFTAHIFKFCLHSVYRN